MWAKLRQPGGLRVLLCTVCLLTTASASLELASGSGPLEIAALHRGTKTYRTLLGVKPPLRLALPNTDCKE